MTREEVAQSGPTVLPDGFAEQESDQTPDYCNPGVVRRNCLPPRTYFIPETSIILNGRWRFLHSATPLESPSPATIDSGTWSSIQVPGHWQLQGYGVPHYTNVQYPFPVCPPYTPTENATGTYKRAFFIPAHWEADAQLRLRFDGVDSAYHVWINNVLVGYAQGSRNPAEFDITKLVHRNGENEVVVKVYQWCDGSYIEDQDQWWLSGIFRDVHLIALPHAARIEDWFLRTDLDGDYDNAVLKALVNVKCVSQATLDVVLLELPEHGGNEVGNARVSVTPDQAQYELQIPVSSPRKWTPETPNLYVANITVTSSDARQHSVTQKVGFRKVELLNGLIAVNGVQVRLRGVNRHDHHPRFGRAVPKDFIWKDLLLMKQHNINALRCAHYPSHPALYDMTDELGLWVMDEADLECHGFYDAVARPKDIPESMDYGERKKLTFAEAAEFTSNNPEWHDAYVDRMVQLVHRDKNHPSIVMWSLGNEAFYGQNHKAMYDWSKGFDPDRPVHYEGDVHAQSADMFSYMYPSAERLLALASTEGVDDAGQYQKSVVLCEYAHAMGNGPGGLLDYEKAFAANPRLQGGFVWEWANHGLWKEDEDGKSYYAYGGDFGEYPHDGTFVMDGLLRSDHQPTPGLLELKTVIQPVEFSLDGSRLVISNLYSYVDLSHLRGTFKIEEFGRSTLLLASGELEMPPISARSAGSIEIPELSQCRRSQHETYFTLTLTLGQSTKWAVTGHEVAWFQKQISKGSINEALWLTSSLPAPKALNCSERGRIVQIQGNGFYFDFDSVRGCLSKWSVAGIDMLVADPSTGAAVSPGFWRPATDNDAPSFEPYWRRFGVDRLTTQLRSFNIDHSDKGATISITSYITPRVLAWGWITTTTYLIAHGGRFSVTVHLRPVGTYPDHVPRVGLDVCLERSLSAIRWLGLGPGESYPDKRSAQRVGIWAVEEVSHLQTPYDVPQENGNRMDTRWMEATCPHGQGLSVRSEPQASRMGADKDFFNFQASLHSAETISKAKHPCDLVEGNVLYLRLDVQTAGVGSGACGPGVREDYLVKTREVAFGFKIDSVEL